MKYKHVCLTCGVELTTKNRSRHQPTIRCAACWPKFAAGITAKLERIRDNWPTKDEREGKA